MARTRLHGKAPGGGTFRMVERTGLRKGLEGNKAWFYVGTGLWTVRTIRRMAQRREEILISERLAPGQRIIIANGRATLEDAPAPATLPRGRRGRKPARRAARRGGAAPA